MATSAVVSWLVTLTNHYIRPCVDPAPSGTSWVQAPAQGPSPWLAPFWKHIEWCRLFPHRHLMVTDAVHQHVVPPRPHHHAIRRFQHPGWSHARELCTAAHIPCFPCRSLFTREMHDQTSNLQTSPGISAAARPAAVVVAESLSHQLPALDNEACCRLRAVRPRGFRGGVPAPGQRLQR